MGSLVQGECLFCTVLTFFTFGLQVFLICYNTQYDPGCKMELKAQCYDFVSKATTVFPKLKHKPKIHLFLHLIECLEDFGPTSSYSAERFVYTIVALCVYCYRIL